MKTRKVKVSSFPTNGKSLLGCAKGLGPGCVGKRCDSQSSVARITWKDDYLIWKATKVCTFQKVHSMSSVETECRRQTQGNGVGAILDVQLRTVVGPVRAMVVCWRFLKQPCLEAKQHK